MMRFRGAWLPVLLAILAWDAASAEQVPQNLASLAARLQRLSGDDLANAGDDAESRAAAQRAGSALRRAGVNYWARDNVAVEDAATQAAKLLGLDLGEPANREELTRLMNLPDGELREALKARRPELDAASLNDLANGLTALRSPEGQPTRHTVDLGDGETVEISWEPATGEVVVRARSDGSGGAPAYDVSMIGRTEMQVDPETRDLRTALRSDPGETIRVLSASDLEHLRGSIIGVWQAENGDIYTISAGTDQAGEITASAEDYDRLIEDAKQELEALKQVREYVWENPETGGIRRQERFRRLEEPWVYKGEELLGAADMTRLEQRIAELEAKRAGADLPPVRRHDPVGYAENRQAEGASPIRISVRQPDGYGYAYDEASFDGRKIAARRTYRDIRDINQELPATIQQQLIASWSPPSWLELQASFDPASGEVRMVGKRWFLHVTYSSGQGLFGDGKATVGSIHTPFSNPLKLGKEGAQTRVAMGAALDAVP